MERTKNIIWVGLSTHGDACCAPPTTTTTRALGDALFRRSRHSIAALFFLVLLLLSGTPAGVGSMDSRGDPASPRRGERGASEALLRGGTQGKLGNPGALRRQPRHRQRPELPPGGAGRKPRLNDAGRARVIDISNMAVHTMI